MPECAIDGRETSDSVLCSGCVQQLLIELRQIPWLTRQLEVTLTRQARTTNRNGPRATEHPLPYHHGASVDLETLRDGLAHWAHQVADRRGVTVDVAHTPPGYARWLALWPSELAGHPDAAELHGDICALTRAARRTIDLAPDLRYVGPCDGHRAIEAETVGCGKGLYAGMHRHTVTCATEGCGAEYPIEARRIWLLEQAVDQLRTARQLAYELPWIAGVTVTAKLIGMWAHRGKITTFLPHAHDERKAARFRVGEVVDHARAMAMEQAGRTVSGAA